VPITFVNAERELGYESRLVTFARNPRGYQEDVCLNLPFVVFIGFSFLKRVIAGKSRTSVINQVKKPDQIPRKWLPNKLEKRLINLRELLWQRRVERLFAELRIQEFDVVQLDGGVGFYRNGRDIVQLRNAGKKIICCYTGSDLRVRGVIPQIDLISDLNVTVEFDHLQLHPQLHHILFPFDTSRFQRANPPDDGTVYIGHAPTNRSAKGSHIIIPLVRKLAQRYPIKLVLIEKLSYQQALVRKSKCHIFIDQIGELGYGINGLEALAMGIATLSCLAPGFDEIYPDNPFIVIDENNLTSRLALLIENPDLRQAKGIAGHEWVKKYHDPIQVVKKVHRLAGI
ncbi:MAG: glycosyltransferase, partial [bacterium]|nr:glycosyltransferase [bacterium]